MRKNFRFVTTAIAQLEIFGALQSHLVHCDRPLAFNRNRGTVKGTILHVRGEVGLQRMKIRRMINWKAGLLHQFSLNYGHLLTSHLCNYRTTKCWPYGALTNKNQMEFQQD